jgi:hypothetical protein
MSNRKNNTKSKQTSNKQTSNKQTTGNSQNDFNSFRIEALEPRLLMSASPTAADWLDEFSSVESIVSGAESDFSSSAVTNELNHDVNDIAA